MTDDLNQVATLAGEMTALRQRLAQLNAERVTIEGQIAGYVDRIAAAAAAGGIPLPAASPGAAPTVEWHDPMPLSAAVLYVMRRSPETAFSAVEIAAILQMTDDVGSIRTHLSRMAKDGRATRVSFGKYKAR
ncbi:MAG TPA: hypothetical protein VGQ46_12990 [Thermoanaerobaculia bacterium]|jgi:hypothetical protein|nr:hypothetical protein [Thermoanaerobaculia bacterium]